MTTMTATRQSAQRQPFSALCGFTPKQWIAADTADTHRFTLFGGSRGPGKSYWLRWYALRQLLALAGRGIHGASWGLFCETYPELQDRHISKIAQEFPPWLGEVRESRQGGLGYYLHGGLGVLMLRNLDDPDKYKSVEFAGVSVDEITRTPKSTFDILRGSLRWPGVTRTQFCAATNPDGRWAEWVRKIWIERDFTGEGFAELASVADEFAFVPALPQDNPHLSDQYWHDLRTAPRHLREAWLEGSWYVRSEGIVYDDFTDDNLSDDAPDMSRPFELAFDDGYIDPRAILFIQRDGARVFVFDEIYETKTLDEASVRHVLERCAHWCNVALPEDWQTLTLEQCASWCRAEGVALPELAIGGSESIQLMKRFMRADIPARGGTHVITEGISHMRRMICDGQGYRSLQIHRRCSNLLREMTQGYRYPEGTKRRDTEKPEDANNHAADALRVWAWMRAR